MMDLKEGQYIGYIQDPEQDVIVGKRKNKQGEERELVEIVVTVTDQLAVVENEVVRIALPEFKRTIRLYLTPKAADYSLDKLDSLGFDGDFQTMRLGDDAYDPQGGLELYMKYEEYEGKEHERWDISTGGRRESDVDPFSTQDAKALSARFRNRYGKKKPAASAPPKKPSAPPPSRAYDKNAAWKDFVAHNDGEPDGDAFNQRIEAREKGSGKTELEFGEPDWKWVAGDDEIPF